MVTSGKRLRPGGDTDSVFDKVWPRHSNRDLARHNGEVVGVVSAFAAALVYSKLFV